MVQKKVAKKKAVPAVAAKKAKNRVCFFISPIGKPDSPERKRCDDVFEFVVTPCAQARGLKPVAAGEIAETGFITTQIIRHLMEAEVVIADFWMYNPNVFYELAIRHFLKKPVIHLYLDAIPFDVSHMRAIQLNHQDIRSVEQAKVSIAKQLNDCLAPGFVQWSPITHAIEVEKLSESDSEADNTVAGLVGDIERLTTGLRRVEAQLAQQAQRSTVGTIYDPLLVHANWRPTISVPTPMTFPASSLLSVDPVPAIGSTVTVDLTAPGVTDHLFGARTTLDIPSGTKAKRKPPEGDG